MSNELSLPVNILDMIEAKDKAAMQIQQSYDLMKAAEQTCLKTGKYLFPYNARSQDDISKVLKCLNRRFWRASFELIGFNKVMDKQAVDEFDRSLEANPPEFNIENVRSTFLSFSADAERIFKRGIVNLFKALSRNYRTNDSFKIGSKFICSGATRPFGMGLWLTSTMDSYITDLDRVLRGLDGKPFVEYQLKSAVTEALVKGDDYEDEYIKARGFYKGTLHIWIKKPELVEKINDIIAAWYGESSVGHK